LQWEKRVELMDEPDQLDGLWVSLSEVARRKGVSVAAVWKRVQRLLRDGKIELRPGRGRERLVNLAAYDRAVGETTDLTRQRGADMARGLPLDGEPIAPPAGTAAGGQTFSAAQRQSMVYQAGLRALEFGERRGALLPIDGEHGVARAARAAGDALVAAVARLPLRAGELVAVASTHGEVGVRRLLKEIGRELLAVYAKSLSEIAASANDADGGFEIDLPEPTEEDAT
jgi:biotin operon repressor